MNRAHSLFFLWMCLTLAATAAEPIIIPFVTDPSPVIDGNLQEWTNRGALREMTRREQVTFSPERWKGAEDLSGWVRFGYDDDYFYVACRVADSFFTQDQSGAEAWRGDHIMLNLDFVRSGAMQDVWQTGLSPGSLKAPDAPGPDTKAEFIVWEPQGGSIEGARVAARRTPEGYDLEAAIPWKLFHITPVKFQTFALELAFSDCDTTPAVQQKAMSIDTAVWHPRDPKRLIPAGLADRAGQFPADAFQKAQKLADAVTLKHGETKEFVIEVPALPEGTVPTFTFKGRVESPTAGGCCGPLAITVNGKGIQPTNIANRPPVVTFRNGGMQTSWYGAGVTLWYGPSFEAIEKSTYKPLDVTAYDYTLRLDGLFKPGRNTITLRHADQRPEIEIVLADLAFSWLPPSRFLPPKEWKPAPTGDLPVCEPAAVHKAAYECTLLKSQAVKISWAKRDVVFESRFSRTDGGWMEVKAEGVTGASPALQWQRSVETLDECVKVTDVLRNTTNADLPVMAAHRAVVGECEDLWLAGRPIPMKNGASSMPSNPSVTVLWKDAGLAVMPRDDVFRIHYRGAYDGKAVEIADNSLVLRPGVEYRQEWLIFPLAAPDYWSFANAARRHFRTNFTIPGSFCFFDLHKEDLPLLPWEISDYLQKKNAFFVCVGLMQSYKGLFPHGPVERTLDPARRIAVNKTVRALRPESKILHYFNSYDCARAPGDPILWPDSRILLPDGAQVHNGAPYPLYFATLSNAYGKEMDAVADWVLNVNGADGLYWDCYDYTTISHYGEPWDGWTGDIDPATHRLARKRSTTTLITWPWRERLTARLLKEGRPIVANGNPALTSEYAYKFPRFVETADISSLSQTHLFTPIALGDHVTERTEVDAYRWMLRALDWGGVYYWYSSRIIPEYPTLTSYMFPITLVELHAGWIVGEERILTNRSGLFGWGDASEFEVHVFDRVGKETDAIKVPRIVRDGKAYAEIRIPEGFAAAIVRK